MIKTTKTTYCPKKLITNNYLLTIRRTSKKIFIYRLKMFIHQESCKVFLKNSVCMALAFLKILGETSSHL